MALILIVDDDELLLGVLKTFLISEGYEVITAENGNKALGLVKAVEFDLMICDIRMSPMTGIELLQLARQERPKLPVIMITAYASEKTAKESIEMGAFAYVTKPFTNVEVLDTVQGALKSVT